MEQTETFIMIISRLKDGPSPLTTEEAQTRLPLLLSLELAYSAYRFCVSTNRMKISEAYFPSSDMLKQDNKAIPLGPKNG